MSSPSHMIRPVPAVMVMTMTAASPQIGITSTVHPLNSWPRATVMIVVDCRTARPIVRYRVYCVAVPDWPSL